jgi:hypothetical protein
MYIASQKNAIGIIAGQAGLPDADACYVDRLILRIKFPNDSKEGGLDPALSFLKAEIHKLNLQKHSPGENKKWIPSLCPCVSVA